MKLCFQSGFHEWILPVIICLPYLFFVHNHSYEGKNLKRTFSDCKQSINNGRYFVLTCTCKNDHTNIIKATFTNGFLFLN